MPHPAAWGARAGDTTAPQRHQSRRRPIVGPCTPPDVPTPPRTACSARAVRRVAHGSARRPKTTIALWLLLVVGFTVGGGMAGTQYLDASDTGTGESARADKRLIDAAGLGEPAVEQILVRSGDADDDRRGRRRARAQARPAARGRAP